MVLTNSGSVYQVKAKLSVQIHFTFAVGASADISRKNGTQTTDLQMKEEAIRIRVSGTQKDFVHGLKTSKSMSLALLSLWASPSTSSPGKARRWLLCRF